MPYRCANFKKIGSWEGCVSFAQNHFCIMVLGRRRRRNRWRNRWRIWGNFENGKLAVPVNITLMRHTVFLAADTLLCVLIYSMIFRGCHPNALWLNDSCITQCSFRLVSQFSLLLSLGLCNITKRQPSDKAKENCGTNLKVHCVIQLQISLSYKIFR